MRAGDYISTIESRLNDEHFEESIMLWENWLRYRGDQQPERDIYQVHYWSQYLIIAVLILTEVFGILTVVVWQPGNIDPVVRIGLLCLYLSFILVMAYILTKVVRHRNIEKSFGYFRDNID